MTIETGALEQSYATLAPVFGLVPSVAPAAPVAVLGGVAGLIDDGDHSWKATFTKTGGGETLPSVKSNVLTTVVLTDGQADVTLPALPATYDGWNIYRTIAGDTGDWKLVGPQADSAGVIFRDNIADSGLGISAPTADATGIPGATDAIRHLELAISSKKNREPSPEKRGTPDESQSLPRRQTTTSNLSSIMWEPSGTLGTESNAAKLIKAALGAQTEPALATTVASAPTTISCTLTSGAGLAVGDIIIVTLASGLWREATRLKTVSGADITFDALSVAPIVGAVVVSGVNFKLANNQTDYLNMFKYYNAGGFEQAAYSWVADQLQVSFDGTREVLLAIQGPAGRYADSTFGIVPTKPASHTTIGAPASGLIGTFYVDGNKFDVIAAQVTIANAEELRNKELGTSFATGIAGRTAMRKVTVQITFYLEDTLLIGRANDVVTGILRCVVGATNGEMVAMVCPKVEFEIPDVGNEVGPKELTIDGVAYATNGNDQVFLAEA